MLISAFWKKKHKILRPDLKVYLFITTNNYNNYKFMIGKVQNVVLCNI